MIWTILFTFISLTTALNQLSFSGGGAFGAVEIGIIQRLMENEPSKAFDLYTGISAGALNAGLLSYFHDIKMGIKTGVDIYSRISSRDVYSLYPPTKISVYNTEPLRKTLTAVISKLSQPLIHTLIGTVNLNTGYLDIFEFETMKTTESQVNLLMSSSAIPVIFPPITIGEYKYVDGGTLSNELLEVEHSGYLNITYISPSNSYVFNSTVALDSLETIVKRELQIVMNNYNDPFVDLYTKCEHPIGEINHYFVDGELLSNYSMLDFDYGKELVSIGYNNLKSVKYNMC